MSEATMTRGSSGGTEARRSTIVVGVDGSESSEAAVQWAAEEARRRGATLVLLHVRQSERSVMTVDSRRYGALALRDTVGVLWQQVTALQEVQIDAVGRVNDGRPDRVLVEASESADLLVLGAEGTGRHRGLLLGDVAQKCARSAHCPVVLVPPPRRRPDE
jgi:nucleotide-binding universal stress UspA family protein